MTGKKEATRNGHCRHGVVVASARIGSRGYRKFRAGPPSLDLTAYLVFREGMKTEQI